VVFGVLQKQEIIGGNRFGRHLYLRSIPLLMPRLHLVLLLNKLVQALPKPDLGYLAQGLTLGKTTHHILIQ
jgi:hypothetical protein